MLIDQDDTDDRETIVHSGHSTRILKKVSYKKFELPNMASDVEQSMQQSTPAAQVISNVLLHGGPSSATAPSDFVTLTPNDYRYGNDTLGSLMNSSLLMLDGSPFGPTVIGNIETHPEVNLTVQQEQREQLVQQQVQQQQQQQQLITLPICEDNGQHPPAEVNIAEFIEAAAAAAARHAVAAILQPINSKFDALEQAVFSLTSKVVSMGKMLQRIPGGDVALAAEEQDQLDMCLPAKTLDELKALNDRLTDKCFQTIIFKKFPPEKIPGRTKALRIIEKFMTLELATHVSLTGITHSAAGTKKASILDFKNVMDIVQGICERGDPSYDAEKNRLFFKSVFQNAATRFTRSLTAPPKRLPSQKIGTKGRKRRHDDQSNDEKSDADEKSVADENSNAGGNE